MRVPVHHVVCLLTVRGLSATTIAVSPAGGAHLSVISLPPKSISQYRFAAAFETTNNHSHTHPARSFCIVKPAFHDADTESDSPDTPNPYVRHARFPEVIPVAS